LRQSEESYRNLKISHDNFQRDMQTWQAKFNQMEGEMLSWRTKSGTLEQEKTVLNNTLQTRTTQLEQRNQMLQTTHEQYDGYELYNIQMRTPLKYVNNSHFSASSWLLKSEQLFAILNLLSKHNSNGGPFAYQKL